MRAVKGIIRVGHIYRACSVFVMAEKERAFAPSKTSCKLLVVSTEKYIKRI